jgi:hypothetical protein
VTMRYTAGNLDGVTASVMDEIWRVNLQFAAAHHGTAPLGAIFHSQPSQRHLSTASLLCCFSAAVCVQVVTGAFWPAEKLPPAVSEGGATSGTCLRALSALASVCRCFKRALAQAGVWAHILACLLLLCVCR